MEQREGMSSCEFVTNINGRSGRCYVPFGCAISRLNPMSNFRKRDKNHRGNAAAYNGIEHSFHLFHASGMTGISFSHHESKRLSRSFVTATRNGLSAECSRIILNP